MSTGYRLGLPLRLPLSRHSFIHPLFIQLDVNAVGPPFTLERLRGFVIGGELLVNLLGGDFTPIQLF